MPKIPCAAVAVTGRHDWQPLYDRTHPSGAVTTIRECAACGTLKSALKVAS